MKVLLREGDRSHQVADVQTRLRELGFSIDDESGHFGDSTTRSVRAFQQQRNVLVDGIVGPNTWSELVEAGYKLGDRVLYLANPLMRGDDVLALQARLNALGFDAGREDGIFGHDSDKAVRSFQREYGVPEDGMFGRLSHAALVGLRVDRPATAAHLREELRRIERAGLHDALVCVDPGHGGEDRGQGGTEGLYEQDICWDLATRLGERLVGAGAQVRLTRTEVEDIDATERARRANDYEADLFVSLHLNSTSEPHAGGASTYYFPRSEAGALLADLIQNELVAAGMRDCRSHPRAYPVLRETRMPAVIVEPAFITNPDEAKQLADIDARNRLADAIATGMLRYFETGP